MVHDVYVNIRDKCMIISLHFFWDIALYILYTLVNDLTNNLAPLDLPAKNLHSQRSQPWGLKRGSRLEEESSFRLSDSHRQLHRNIPTGPKEGCAYGTFDV